MSTLTTLPQPGDIGSVVATELRVLMARHSETQRGMAVVLGISQSQMSKRMNGTIPFDIYELDSLASHFGVTVAALVGGMGRPGGGGPDGTPSPDSGTSDFISYGKSARLIPFPAASLAGAA